MKKPTQALRRLSLLSVYSLSLVLVPLHISAAPKGTVDCTLEWHTTRQTYTYVFTGVVSKQGRPCANARIQLLLSTNRQPDQIQETTAAADGSYELKIALPGNPEDSADWKLVAQAPDTSTLEATEVAGRMILTDGENTVMVERPIQLING
jgi:hypothetical protein